MNWCKTRLSRNRPIACTIDYQFETKPYDPSDTMAYHHPFRNHVDIYLQNIHNLEELYNTIRHEALHECFMSEDLDADVEHAMIDALDWFVDDIYEPTDLDCSD